MKKPDTSHTPQVEIITIGDELLIGQVVDTNSAWMARELNKEGFKVFRITTVPDEEIPIREAIDGAFSHANVVLITGGIGPTKDDITKQTLCNYFETELVFSPEVLDNIQALFKNRPSVLNELTNSQAYVPKSATIIQNKRGTAPITWFDRREKVLVSMPGVPNEMEWTMEHEIIPRLKKRFKTPSLQHQTILVQGIPESALAIRLTNWENDLPECIKLAYLPSPGMVKLRMTGWHQNPSILHKQMQQALAKLRPILGAAILAEEDVPVETVIGRLLKEKNFQLGTAESCTGGYLAHRITTIPGSSAYFKGSIVAYSNNAKEKLLGVSTDTLTQWGAVSQEVVEQMAQGILQRLETNVAVAVSGIAGPDGGTVEKPVGTVWIAVCTHEKQISRKFQFGNLRDRNIYMATLAALSMIKEIIE